MGWGDRYSGAWWGNNARSTSFWIFHRLRESRWLYIFLLSIFNKSDFRLCTDDAIRGFRVFSFVFWPWETTRSINQTWDVEIKSGSEQVVAPTDSREGALPFLGHWNKYPFCSDILEWNYTKNVRHFTDNPTVEFDNSRINTYYIVVHWWTNVLSKSFMNDSKHNVEQGNKLEVAWGHTALQNVHIHT